MTPPESTAGESSGRQGSLRVVPVLLAVLVGVAFVGFLVGVGQNRAETPFLGVPRTTTRTPDVLPSMAYHEISAHEFGPNAHFENRLTTLVPRPAPGLDLGQEMSARLDSLDQRAARRAFNGAPPTIPHPIDTVSSASCLACHLEGLRIGEVVARKIPHEAYASCTQCHAPDETSRFEDIPIANAFDGIAAPTHGDRAWPGAPPVVPHTTHMRSDCLACHGPNGYAGMRTLHPERKSCLQCHAQSAPLDRLPVTAIQSHLFLPDPRSQ